MSPRDRAAAFLALVAALLLAACGPAESGSAPDPVREPYAREEPLPVVDTAGARLPFSFQGLTVVDPGWTATTPRYVDGIYLAATERDGLLEFTAVDVHGEVRWAAQRPLSCTGFDVTLDASGRALAVLTDSRTTPDAVAATSASAYDLATGDPVWGPVSTPGPYQGPGLVFAAPPEAAMGESGPRTALDPTTGRAVATEGDAGVDRILGEYDGVVLIIVDGDLVARAASDDQEVWRISTADHGWDPDALRPAAGAEPTDGYALVDTSQDTSALIEVGTGDVVSEGAREAVVDPTTGTVVVRDDDGLVALDAEHRRLWSQSVAEATSVAAVGGVFLYLRDEGAVRAHNVLTGAVAEAYDPQAAGPISVPAHITAVGAALLEHEGGLVLATVPEQPGGEASPSGPAGR